MDDWENDDDFYELPRKPGCGRVLQLPVGVILRLVVAAAAGILAAKEEIGRKHGFRLMTPEEWAEKRAKEKALHTDAAM